MKTNKAKLHSIDKELWPVAMEALEVSISMEDRLRECRCNNKLLYRLGVRKCPGCEIARELKDRAYQMYLTMYTALDPK